MECSICERKAWQELAESWKLFAEVYAKNAVYDLISEGAIQECQAKEVAEEIKRAWYAGALRNSPWRGCECFSQVI